MVAGTSASSANRPWLRPLLSRASCRSPAAGEGAKYECIITQVYHTVREESPVRRLTRSFAVECSVGCPSTCPSICWDGVVRDGSSWMRPPTRIDGTNLAGTTGHAHPHSQGGRTQIRPLTRERLGWRFGKPGGCSDSSGATVDGARNLAGLHGTQYRAESPSNPA